MTALLFPSVLAAGIDELRWLPAIAITGFVLSGLFVAAGCRLEALLDYAHDVRFDFKVLDYTATGGSMATLRGHAFNLQMRNQGLSNVFVANAEHLEN